MGAVVGPVILGMFISVLGISNMKGNISSVHWYHRSRVTEENRLPFGRMIGLGTIVIGVSVAAMGCLTFIAEKTGNDVFSIIGAGVVIVGSIAGLALSFCAMFKYNKGIF